MLTEILKKVQFAQRYQDLANQFSLEGRMEEIDAEQIQSILTEMDIEATYNKKEKFFKIHDTVNSYLVQLNIAFSYAIIEFILYIENKEKNVKEGGTYGRLLKQFDPKIDRFIRIPFADLAELKSVLKSGVEIYDDIKSEVESIES